MSHYLVILVIILTTYTANVDKLLLEIHSRGFGQSAPFGYCSYITINGGNNIIPCPARGYNLLVMSQIDGSIIYTETYDVCACSGGSNQQDDILSTYINTVPKNGQVIVVITDDDPENGDDTFNLLKSWGGCTDQTIIGKRSSFIWLGTPNNTWYCQKDPNNPIHIFYNVSLMTNSPTVYPTVIPTTSNPTTNIPTTSIPTNNLPTTSNPTTITPTTNAPSTFSPTTFSPTTFNPTTNVPTTFSPTTNVPSSINPTTSNPTTVAPTANVGAVDEVTIVTTKNYTFRQPEETNDFFSKYILMIIVLIILFICCIILCIIYFKMRSKRKINVTENIMMRNVSSDSSHKQYQINNLPTIELMDNVNKSNEKMINMNKSKNMNGDVMIKRETEIDDIVNKYSDDDIVMMANVTAGNVYAEDAIIRDSDEGTPIGDETINDDIVEEGLTDIGDLVVGVNK